MEFSEEVTRIGPGCRCGHALSAAGVSFHSHRAIQKKQCSLAAPLSIAAAGHDANAHRRSKIMKLQETFSAKTARWTDIFNLSDLRPLPAADSQINSGFL